MSYTTHKGPGVVYLFYDGVYSYTTCRNRKIDAYAPMT